MNELLPRFDRRDTLLLLFFHYTPADTTFSDVCVRWKRFGAPRVPLIRYRSPGKPFHFLVGARARVFRL